MAPFLFMHWHTTRFRIDLTQPIRTVSFENPSGAKGAAATTHGGRKGAPFRMLAPGERRVDCSVWDRRDVIADERQQQLYADEYRQS